MCGRLQWNKINAATILQALVGIGLLQHARQYANDKLHIKSTSLEKVLSYGICTILFDLIFNYFVRFFFLVCLSICCLLYYCSLTFDMCWDKLRWYHAAEQWDTTKDVLLFPDQPCGTHSLWQSLVLTMLHWPVECGLYCKLSTLWVKKDQRYY